MEENSFATVEEMKSEAVERMRLLNLDKNCIKAFLGGKVWESERQNALFDGILYEITNQKTLDKIKEVEEDGNKLVYHCQKTYTEFGTLVAMLYVERDKLEWQFNREDLKCGEQLAFVYNLSDDNCSEYGYIGIESRNGGITRTW